MNDLDLLEIVRVTLDAIDALAESELRKTGSMEAQKAAGLARRARVALDGAIARGIAQAS